MDPSAGIVDPPGFGRTVGKVSVLLELGSLMSSCAGCDSLAAWIFHVVYPMRPWCVDSRRKRLATAWTTCPATTA